MDRQEDPCAHSLWAAPQCLGSERSQSFVSSFVQIHTTGTPKFSEATSHDDLSITQTSADGSFLLSATNMQIREERQRPEMVHEMASTVTKLENHQSTALAPQPSATSRKRFRRQSHPASTAFQGPYPQDFIQQLQNVTSQEILGFISSEDERGSLTVEAYDQLRVVLRQVKNRESANRSRLRKTQELVDLKNKLARAKENNQALRGVVEKLKNLLRENHIDVPLEIEAHCDGKKKT